MNMAATSEMKARIKNVSDGPMYCEDKGNRKVMTATVNQLEAIPNPKPTPRVLLVNTSAAYTYSGGFHPITKDTTNRAMLNIAKGLYC